MKDEQVKRLERVVSYRILSLTTEGIIVYVVTGSWEFSVIIAPLCVVVHTLLHYIIDKVVR